MKTRSLAEGAMLGAITVLLSIIGEYLGLPPLIVPVPLIILVYRHGARSGIFAALAAAVVSGLVGGHVFAGVTIIIWGFIGIAVGVALAEKMSFPKLLAVGVFSVGVVMFLEFLLFSLVFGENLLNELLNLLVTSLEQAKELSEGLGASGKSVERLDELLATVPFLLKWGLPALLLGSGVGVAFINLAATRIILKRLGDSMAWVAPFTQWRIPSYYSLPLVLGWLATVLAQLNILPPALQPAFQFVGLNVFIVFYHAYLILGVAVVWHFFNQMKVPGILRALFVLLLFSWGFLVLAGVFLGLTDNVFDFRKLRKSDNQGGQAE